MTGTSLRAAALLAIASRYGSNLRIRFGPRAESVSDPAEPVDPRSSADSAEVRMGWFAMTDLPEPLAPGVRMHLRSGLRTAFGD